jgi:hypothetical protein
MKAKPMTHGDFRRWSIEVLHQQLEKVINAKQHRNRPYYILAIIQLGYLGPAASLAMEEGPNITKTKTINLEGKTVFSCRLILMEQPPVVPMLGSGLWLVDNRIGQVKCLYILPPDVPVDSKKDMNESSDLVGEGGKHMPLVYNEKN